MGVVLGIIALLVAVFVGLAVWFVWAVEEDEWF